MEVLPSNFSNLSTLPSAPRRPQVRLCFSPLRFKVTKERLTNPAVVGSKLELACLWFNDVVFLKNSAGGEGGGEKGEAETREEAGPRRRVEVARVRRERVSIGVDERDQRKGGERR